MSFFFFLTQDSEHQPQYAGIKCFLVADTILVSPMRKLKSQIPPQHQFLGAQGTPQVSIPHISTVGEDTRQI